MSWADFTLPPLNLWNWWQYNQKIRELDDNEFFQKNRDLYIQERGILNEQRQEIFE